ncbi:MAG: DUF1501 domain-containing protein [Planctomycetes bacterium]|nr:DUF1501 domain-containing protein [Planctomycetota bacterium]
MLTMLGSPKRTCEGFTRRQALQAACGLALAAPFGIATPQAANALKRRRPGRAKNVILLYLLGGAATQDMIDLKPNAPSGVRGEFNPIATNVTGIRIGEHLPRMSQWMHKIALVRSLNHRAGCHNTLPSYTGLEQLLDNTNTRDTYPPSMGAVCEWLRQRSLPSRSGRGAGGEGGRQLPDYIYMPCYLGWGQAIRRPGPYAGYLGQRFDPLYTEVQPYRAPGSPAPAPGRPVTVLGEPRLPESTLAQGVTIDRLNTRRTLMNQIEDQLRNEGTQRTVDQFNRTQSRAFNLLTSTEVRSAFDLNQEDNRLRDRYGKTLFGNCALIARRLVERDVRFVNVTWDLFWDRVQINYDAWDTHTRNFEILRNVNLPEFDKTYCALLEDLETRGLLDETLVVVMSEMGRTPNINGNAGRDHWTYCYGMWFAGGGIRGGTVVGESDGQAAYVKDRPVSPADVCATIYECLGIDPDLMVPDRAGRPIAAAQGGRPIREILG